jgi:hypothetical protein
MGTQLTGGERDYNMSAEECRRAEQRNRHGDGLEVPRIFC